ncbi:MAG: ABC transporter permease subunit [Eubacteriales bacterium]|nr:ABC transporter permease subunit [Eubacteriales bacterium]
MSNINDNNKKKTPSLLSRWFKRAFFGPHRELSFMEEEALQSPLRTMADNFFARKLSVFGLVTFLLIFLFVMLGPIFVPIDLSYQDNTQMNVAPGMNMMSVPREIQGSLVKIAPGKTFGLGLDKNGKTHLWGYTRITDTINLARVPQEVLDARIKDIAVGYDHAVAIDESGKFHIWGNTRLGQDRLTTEMSNAMRRGDNLNIVQIEAGNQFSAAVSEDGHLYLWGNSNLNDIKMKSQYQDHVAKVAININTYLVLTKDGAVAYPGFQENVYSRIPEGLDKGVVDIAATSNTNAALKEDGSLVFWGNITKGENQVPEHLGKIISIHGGRNHYTALTDQQEVLSWGSNTFGESSVPDFPQNATIENIYTGSYQNYALTSQGDVITWGLKGYVLGTDHLGRDILTRIISGGRVTMTVGAVSVIIAVFIGIIMGGLSGYFGGWVDIVIMRIVEVVGGLPFLPFALILSAIIGTRITVEQRMYLIMVVLGLLSWPSLARLVRAQILAQREMEYVTAAQALGVREGAIVFKHIIPNVISVIIVSATLSFATSMLTESTLSYLGFGISPPTPTWGNMLTGSNNSVVIQQYWWRWVFPALIFSICTICINLIGDGLRDAIDPKSNER